MRKARTFLLIFVGSIAAAGCGESGPVQLDILEAGPARFAAVAPSAGTDAIPFEVDVRAVDLAAALDRGAVIELAIVDCGSPDVRRATLPLALGGEAVNDLHSSQVSSDDPTTQVLLSTAVPPAAVATARPCARPTRAASGPEINSRPVPLRR